MEQPSTRTADSDITVHVIFQAHLDPIWLWPWQSGLDALLATCRSACDRLDAHPDVFFTRGEAWTYWQIEQVDPPLFERIREHIAGGRWEIVGGWWIQPDCNIPSGEGFSRQIELGKAYFLEHFGQFPKTAYNVDSFGHAATLPTLMRAAGQSQYVMMRPQEHEMQLPARLFRWQEAAGTPEVVTFRIAGSYNTSQVPSVEHVRKSVTELPDGIRHTMCFIGLGDHGGGPTERMIAWCRENRSAVPGCRLEFSTVGRFFDSIAAQADLLPVVRGELQYHAIGCYTVGHALKRGVRRGEQLLLQAEVAQARDPKPAADSAARLTDAWRDICFHQFHDTLGGTCLPSAYEVVYAQIGRASAVADNFLQHSLRRQLSALGNDPLQRIVFFNASNTRFNDYVEVEPWLDWAVWKPGWRLLDERGAQVPCQPIESEALTNGQNRLLLRLSAEPGQLRVLRIDTSATEAVKEAAVITAQTDTVTTLDGTSVNLCDGWLSFAGRRLALPTLELIVDESDTWSHGIDRYGDEAVDVAHWDAIVLADCGPVMASLIQKGRIGRSSLQAEYRVYKDVAMVELLLRVQWTEGHKLLKLTLPLPADALSRFDGIPGGELERPLSGRESPIRDRTLVKFDGGSQLGVVCPEVYALDCTPRRLRLSLLRSPLMAHHEPHGPQSMRGRVSDRGEHDFRFRIFFGPQLSGGQLDEQALAYHRPLIAADLTRGMPSAPPS